MYFRPNSDDMERSSGSARFGSFLRGFINHLSYWLQPKALAGSIILIHEHASLLLHCHHFPDLRMLKVRFRVTYMYGCGDCLHSDIFKKRNCPFAARKEQSAANE
jgi:hypothetical protein